MSDTLPLRPSPIASTEVPVGRGLTALVLASVVTGCGALAAEVLAPRAAPVWGPLLAATLVLFVFFVLRGRGVGRPTSVFEIGFVYAAAVWLYACYPLVGYLVNGLEYGPMNDIRLYLAAPAPTEVGRIGWMYVVHLASFVAVYSCCRGATIASAPPRVARVEGLLLLVLVAIAQGYFLFLGWRFQWNFTSNLDRYVALANLPQLTAQIAGHLEGIGLTAEIALLIFLFQRYKKYRILIFAWLALAGVKTFVERQSRTELVLLCFASLILYDIFVRRVRILHLVGLAVAGLIAFNLLGARRIDPAEVSERFGWRQLFVANEFETLFANAYDLDERVRSGTLDPPPSGIYATDILALVPQQFMTWQKVTPADWYIKTMYPNAASAGIGFCFGSVSESIISRGWLDLVMRGGLLGMVVGLLRRGIESRKARSFWWFLFGIWLSVLIYQSFRNTTLTLVAMVWYRFLPVVLAVGVGSWLLRAAFDRGTDARRS